MKLTKQQQEMGKNISSYENFLLHKGNLHTNPNCKDDRFCKPHGSLENQGVTYDAELAIGYIHYLETILSDQVTKAHERDLLELMKVDLLVRSYNRTGEPERDRMLTEISQALTDAQEAIKKEYENKD